MLRTMDARDSAFLCHAVHAERLLGCRNISSKKEASLLPSVHTSLLVLLRAFSGSEFSAYDETGLPTHDRDGNALPKSAVKKLAKASRRKTAEGCCLYFSCCAAGS